MSRRHRLARALPWLLLSGCGRAPPAPVADLPPPRSARAAAPAPLPSVAASPSASAVASVSASPAVAASPRHFAGGGPGSVSGARGIVTSSEAQATHAGVSILERGGNAVDAAVATAFALAVTHPSAGNIGGGGFMLVRRPGVEATTTAIDFRETAPSALTRASFDRMQLCGAKGGAAVGIPGSVAGLLLAHERFGKLSRSYVFTPACVLDQICISLRRGQART